MDDHSVDAKFLDYVIILTFTKLEESNKMTGLKNDEEHLFHNRITNTSRSLLINCMSESRDTSPN